MTYRRPLLILVATLLLNAVPLGTDVRAQPRRVEGRVVDASNEASLPFTNVAIVGSQRGTTTNENGRFLLAVDSFPVRLAISYIGYQRVERRVTPSTADSVVVRLKEKPVSMAEVVVEGRTGAYFTRKARERLERLSKKRRALTEPVRGFYRQKTFYSPKRNDGTLKEDTVYTEYMGTFYNAFTSPFGILHSGYEDGPSSRRGMDEREVGMRTGPHSPFTSRISRPSRARGFAYRLPIPPRRPRSYSPFTRTRTRIFPSRLSVM
jgi:hypothetical protein